MVQMSVVSKLVIVAVVLVVTFILLYLPMQLRETFDMSSSQLLMTATEEQGTLTTAESAASDVTLRNLQNTESLRDTDELLTVNKCYKFPYKLSPGDMSTQEFGAYTVQFNGLYPSLSEITSRIVNEIVSFRQSITDEYIKGDVYVLLFQVPYYKNDRGNPIHVGYDTQLTDFFPSNLRDTIYTQVFVIFGNYDAYKEYAEESLFDCVRTKLNEKYASNDQQCFIRCRLSDMACGCASGAPGIYGNQPDKDAIPDADPLYYINCIDDKLKVSSYGMLYSINKQSSQVRNHFNPPDMSMQ